MLKLGTKGRRRYLKRLEPCVSFTCQIDTIVLMPAQKAEPDNNKKEQKSPAAPAGTRIRDLSITSPAL